MFVDIKRSSLEAEGQVANKEQGLQDETGYPGRTPTYKDPPPSRTGSRNPSNPPDHLRKSIAGRTALQLGGGHTLRAHPPSGDA